MKELGIIKAEPTKENGLIPIELGDGTRVYARWLPNSQPLVNMAVTVIKTSTGVYVAFSKNAPIGISKGKKSQQTKPRYDWDVDYPNGEVWNEPIEKKKIKEGVVVLFVCPYISPTQHIRYYYSLFKGEEFLYFNDKNTPVYRLTGELFVDQTESLDTVICHISDTERVPWFFSYEIRDTFRRPDRFEIIYVYIDTETTVRKDYPYDDRDVSPYYIGEGSVIVDVGQWETLGDDILTQKPMSDFKIQLPVVPGWGTGSGEWWGTEPASSQTGSCCFPITHSNFTALIPSIDRVTYNVTEVAEDIKRVEGMEGGKHYILSNGVEGIQIDYTYNEANTRRPFLDDYPTSFKFTSRLLYKSKPINQKPSFSYGHSPLYKEEVESLSDSRIDNLIYFPMDSLWPRKRGWFVNYWQKPAGGLQFASILNGKLEYQPLTGVLSSEKLVTDVKYYEVNTDSLDCVFLGSTIVYSYREDNKIYQILGVVDGFNYEVGERGLGVYLNIELDKASKKEVPYDYYLENCEGNATIYSFNSSFWDVYRSDFVANIAIRKEDWANSVIYGDYWQGNDFSGVPYKKLSEVFTSSYPQPDRGTNRSVSWRGDCFYVSHLPRPFKSKSDCPDNLKIMAEVYKLELNNGLYELVRQNDVYETEIPMDEFKKSDIWDSQTPVFLQSISLPKDL